MRDRDEFAKAALIGILASDQWRLIVIKEAVEKDKRVLSVIAKSAYDMADTMMEVSARETD